MMNKKLASVQHEIKGAAPTVDIYSCSCGLLISGPKAKSIMLRHIVEESAEEE